MRAFVADGCAPLFLSCVAPNRAALQYRSIQYVHLLCRGLAWPRQTVRPAAGRRGKSVRDKSGRQGAGAKPGHFLEVTRHVLVSLGPCLLQIVGAFGGTGRSVPDLETGLFVTYRVPATNDSAVRWRLPHPTACTGNSGSSSGQSLGSFVFGSVPV